MKSKNYHLACLAAAILAVGLTAVPMRPQAQESSHRLQRSPEEGKALVSSVLTTEATTFVKIRF